MCVIVWGVWSSVRYESVREQEPLRHSDTSKAVLLILKRNEKGTSGRDNQKSFFFQGQTHIKGVIFFGMPFKGSRAANVGASLATNLRLPLNKTHIMYLRVENQDVAKFVDEFVKVTDQIDLPLLIFFELKKTKVLFFRERVKFKIPRSLRVRLITILRLSGETLPGPNSANGYQKLVFLQTITNL